MGVPCGPECSTRDAASRPSSFARRSSSRTSVSDARASPFFTLPINPLMARSRRSSIRLMCRSPSSAACFRTSSSTASMSRWTWPRPTPTVFAMARIEWPSTRSCMTLSRRFATSTWLRCFLGAFPERSAGLAFRSAGSLTDVERDPDPVFSALTGLLPLPANAGQQAARNPCRSTNSRKVAVSGRRSRGGSPCRMGIVTPSRRRHSERVGWPRFPEMAIVYWESIETCQQEGPKWFPAAPHGSAQTGLCGASPRSGTGTGRCLLSARHD